MGTQILRELFKVQNSVMVFVPVLHNLKSDNEKCMEQWEGPWMGTHIK